MKALVASLVSEYIHNCIFDCTENREMAENIEITDEMIEAGVTAIFWYGDSYDSFSLVREVYKEMESARGFSSVPQRS